VAKEKAELYYRDIFWDFPLLKGTTLEELFLMSLETEREKQQHFLVMLYLPHT